MTDTFNSFTAGLESPPESVIGVTPDDAQDLTITSRALNVAQSGTVRVTTLSGSDATVFVAAGIAFPIRVNRIWQSGTTATGIVIMY